MLTRLVIQDVVLIDRLSVPFERGLNVFTGETGAGKSILLDALALALGARSDAGLVRAGCDLASVTAEFSLPASSSFAALVEEHGLAMEDPIILRRTISKEGKSRAYMCDQPISVTLLRRMGEMLLEIHGQFETFGLLSPAVHKDLLDSFGSLGKVRDTVAEAYAQWRRATSALDEAKATVAQSKAEEDFLRLAIEALDEVHPQPNEIDTLTQQRVELASREKIVETLAVVEHALSGDKGALASLAIAGKALAKISDKAPKLSELLLAVDRAASEANEAANQLAQYSQNIDHDALSLDKIEERLFRLRALARKHGVQPDALSALHEELRERLSLLGDETSYIEKLKQQADTFKTKYVDLAGELSKKRKESAEKLAQAVTRELKPLKLDRSRFFVAVESLSETHWTADGMDSVAFLSTMNASTTPAPIHKIASGGELSRFMLALKVVLSKASPVRTLVFDEIDTGIGGETASAVGTRLALLSFKVQTLVVTHSPQIAAKGSHHLRVRKQEKGRYPTTLVDVLDPEDRIEEIARMIAGDKLNDAARDAACSLLDLPRLDQKTSKVKKLVS